MQIPVRFGHASRIVALVLLGVAVTSLTTHATGQTGSIQGTVLDAVSSAPLANFTVAAYDASGAHVQTVSTDAAGAYSLAGLPAGTYYVRTHASAFANQNYIDEVYNNITCWGCPVTSGAPVAVTDGATTAGINFALSPGGRITGTVRDAVNAAVLPNVLVWTYNASGTFSSLSFTNGNGVYTASGLPTGSYRVRAVGTATHVGELYFDIQCSPDCDVTVGAAVGVNAPNTTSGIDFSLDRTGALAGTITNASSGAAIANITVSVYSTTGALVGSTITSGTGTYVVTGLPTGTYYARTFNAGGFGGFHDEIFNDRALCFPSCLPTSGTPISVTAGTTTGGVDFALTPGTELIRNGDFAAGMNFWSLFATPNSSYLVSQIAGEVFNYYRVPPPAGTSNQAVILQGTGAALPANTPLIAQFDVGNASPFRRRISVLIHETDFSDLSVCTFWLEPNTPRTRYGMRTHTTTPWTNATISFYAASADNSGAYYQLDNISMQVVPGPPDARTDCMDPTTPGAPGGAPGAELLTNADFSSGTTGWTTFGQLVSQATNGKFEFYNPGPSSGPAGVILQPTGAAAPIRQIFTAQFDLGNSSGVRKRVTVLLHDLNFSDLTACTFWLSPGQPLQTYIMRGFATTAWTTPTISVYAASIGTEQWTEVDNVSFRRTPGQVIGGTACIEPGGSTLSPEPAPDPQDPRLVGVATADCPQCAARVFEAEVQRKQRRPRASEEY